MATETAEASEQATTERTAMGDTEGIIAAVLHLPLAERVRVLEAISAAHQLFGAARGYRHVPTTREGTRALVEEERAKKYGR